MKKTLTYAQLSNMKEPLEALMRKELPVSEAVEVSRLYKKLKDEFDTLQERQRALCDKYGTLDSEKGVYSFEGESREPFAREMEELLVCSFEYEGEKITVSADITLRGADILALDGIISFKAKGATP